MSIKDKDISFGKFCARSLVSCKGQSSPKLSFSCSRSCVSAQSAPGPFVEVAASPLPELVTEAFSDPSFQRQVRGFEAMPPALLIAPASLSSPASASASHAVVAHARSTPMHCAHNSWSDTGRVQGPTGRSCTKGGGSGPAEDLRLSQRCKFPTSRRCTGAGCRFTSQEATRHRYQVKGRGGAAATSLHPEVPGIQFVSPGYGLDIRQPMGWTKVCGTTRSGIWALKGNARARMLPENLDYLPVGWISRDHMRPPGLRQGTTVCVHTKMEQQSDHKLTTPSGMGLLVCGAGSHPSYHLGVVRRMCQRG